MKILRGFAFAICVSNLINAQVDMGALAGSVTDPTAGVVANARISIRNENTNIITRVISNEFGLYLAPLLKAGKYGIEVEASGFKRANRTGITLQVQDRLRVDFRLEVGEITDSVDVTGEVPLVQSESSTTGVVIDTAKVAGLPLNGRDWLSLGKLAPGVVSTYRARDRSFTANGMRSIQNTYVLDGVVNVSYMRGLDNRRRDVVHPTVDSLAEFKVQTGTYSAEFGQAAGAVVNATIKSGANRPFGTLFEFGRNSAFDAIPYFQPPGTPVPLFNRHQFGGSAGGRVIRDRTFFFVAYEGLRQVTASPQVASVPITAARSGNFAPTPIYDPASLRANPNGAGFVRDLFPGSLIPSSRIEPVAAKLANVFPVASLPGVARNFVANPKDPINVNQMDSRVDHRLGDRDNIFGRFSFYNSSESSPAPLPPPANPLANIRLEARGAAGSWIHTVSAAAVNEVRYGFNSFLNAMETGTPRDDYGIANSLWAGVPGPPVVVITGLTNIGAQQNMPINKTSVTHQFLDNLTYARGRHTYKAGVDVRLIMPYTQATLNGKGTINFNGVYTQNPLARTGTGSAFADFLLGYASDGTIGTPIIVDERGRIFSIYFQDDWRVNRRLTLNLGARYELAPPYFELQNRLSDFIYAAGAQNYGTFVAANTGGLSRSILYTDTNNISPRFGFAYEAASKTVVRGGYGIFYGQDEGTGVSNRITSNPPFVANVSFTSDQINPYLTLGAGFPAGAVNPTNVRFPIGRAYPVDFPLPYVQQWSFNMQRQLGHDWVFEAGYVGSRSLKLVGSRILNQPLPGPGDINSRRPFYGFGAIQAIEPHNRSSYNGLNLRAEHRFAKAFTTLASYTWGHAIDLASSVAGEDDFSVVAQNGRDLRSERADAAFDLRQRFALSYQIELPFGHGRRFVNQGLLSHIVGNWDLAGLTEAETGRPFNIVSSRDSSNTGATARPNRIGSGMLPADQRTTARWYDTSAFVIAPDYGFGNSPRNPLHGPGRLNFDLGIHRRFAIRERISLQFRGEMFNALNTPQLGDPNGTIGSAVAGSISTTITPMRQVQLSLKLIF